MESTNNVMNLQFDVNKRIDSEIQNVMKSNTLAYPDNQGSLVKDFTRKIEGTYNVARSKEDTDNAIDLLYIAYNTTPQEEAKIRVQIDELADRLIYAQRMSKEKMEDAVFHAGKINSLLKDTLCDWNKLRSADDGEALKEFLSEDLNEATEYIKKKADAISNELGNIAKKYDDIIADASTATHESELALAARMVKREEAESDIAKNIAEQQKLETLVDELKIEINKYEVQAAEYKSRAETAEERAFIMSIVQVGAQMVASMTPAIMAGITGVATGGTSLVVASACGSARSIINHETAVEEKDETAVVIEKRKELADLASEKVTSEREKAELEIKGKELSEEITKIDEDKKKDDETKKSDKESVNKRIKDNNDAIAEKVKKITAAEVAINAINASLKVLDEKMGKMSEKQEQNASSLRDMQMNMLNKVEAYEKEKRTQSAELAKINALLKSKRSSEEVLQLTIQSLNLSIQSMKRVREIIREIAFFFKSFSNFMQTVSLNSTEQSEMLKKALAKNRFSQASFVERIVRYSDEFLISQAAEWQAVAIVSEKFVESFAAGMTKLNKLMGNYLTGDKLNNFLNSASIKIDEIASSREQASRERDEEIKIFRERIKNSTSAI